MPREEGKWRLLNPLSIRFSQPRVAPHFRETEFRVGTVKETANEVTTCPLEPANGYAGPPPPYDVVLVPPFPSVRVVSFRPKLRNAEGAAEKDADGFQLLGERAWFALDNRRLCAMQRAAATRYPQRCCVAVRCLEDVPGSGPRELRKFRTTTEGRSVDIGVRASESFHWCWQDALPRNVMTTEPLEAEGVFAEDLFDADYWAPAAVAAGARDGGDDCADAAASPAEGDDVPGGGGAPHSYGANGTGYPRGGGAPHAYGANGTGYPRSGGQANGGGAAKGTGYPRSGGQANGGGPAKGALSCKLVACPESGWQYVDPKGNIQGPFTLDEMRRWNEFGYFLPDLPMRCNLKTKFVRFVELFPAPVRPFESSFRWVDL